MSGPLHGLRVIEFAAIGPAPLAGQLLADLGAEVICVDRADGPADPTDINRRNKRSVVLNLKDGEGAAAARALVSGADILIEGFRPGVMEKLGLGPADLPATIIYGRMTGWGQTGPLASRAGHDINYLAITGALNAIGRRGELPVPPLNLVADFGGGAMFLVFGILAAVFERQRSGRGQIVDAAMVDGVPALMGLLHGFLARQEWQEARGSNLLDGGAPFYRCYECLDGKAVAVGALESQFFSLLIDGTGLSPEWKGKQYDQGSWPELEADLAAAFKRRERDEWAGIFEDTDACVTPVLSFSEADEHPHNRARGIYLASRDHLEAAPAPRFSRTMPHDPTPPHAPGAQTAEILARLVPGAGFSL